jgi:hypothetical protein
MPFIALQHRNTKLANSGTTDRGNGMTRRLSLPSLIGTFALTIAYAPPVATQSIIDEWDSVKTPAAPPLQPVMGTPRQPPVAAAVRGQNVIVPVDGMSSSDTFLEQYTFSEQYTASHFANAPVILQRVTPTKINMDKF